MTSHSSKSAILAIVGGSTLLALAPVALFIPTALELNLGNWFQLGIIFTASLFLCIVVGLGLIVLPFTPNWGAGIKTALVILLIGCVITWFAGGRQLAAGPVETVGTVGEVVWSKNRDGLVVDPINKKVNSQRRRKHDLVSIRGTDGAVSTITLVRADTDELLAFRDQQGKSNELRLVALHHFKRLLSVEVAPMARKK